MRYLQHLLEVRRHASTRTPSHYRLQPGGNAPRPQSQCSASHMPATAPPLSSPGEAGWRGPGVLPKDWMPEHTSPLIAGIVVEDEHRPPWSAAPRRRSSKPRPRAPKSTLIPETPFDD